MYTRPIQSDSQVRVVALSNLVAMCDRISGICHRFAIEKVTRSRVHVSYSNPDEYGHESPMIAVYPCYPTWGDTLFGSNRDNPAVVLDILRVIHDNRDGEGWQAFEPLRDFPVLWHNPASGKWDTSKEIQATQGVTA